MLRTSRGLPALLRTVCGPDRYVRGKLRAPAAQLGDPPEGGRADPPEQLVEVAAV